MIIVEVIYGNTNLSNIFVRTRVLYPYCHYPRIQLLRIYRKSLIFYRQYYITEESTLHGGVYAEKITKFLPVLRKLSSKNLPESR
jgi:hypothetical protein